MNTSSRLYYERNGHGEPMVLFHGTGSYLRAWAPVLPFLTEHYEVITVDLPGFGNSPDAVDDLETFETLVASIEAFLDELGLEQPHTAGNSVGGWIALELAKRRRARSVVALSPCGLWKKAPKYIDVITRISYRLAKILHPWGHTVMKTAVVRTLMMSHTFARPWALTPEEAHALVRNMRISPGTQTAYAMMRDARFTGGKEIDVPVTVAFGQHDRALFRPQRRRDELPEHTIWKTIPGCGHVPMSDQPERVARVILEGAAAANDAAMPLSAGK